MLYGLAHLACSRSKSRRIILNTAAAPDEYSLERQGACLGFDLPALLYIAITETVSQESASMVGHPYASSLPAPSSSPSQLSSSMTVALGSPKQLERPTPQTLTALSSVSRKRLALSQKEQLPGREWIQSHLSLHRMPSPAVRYEAAGFHWSPWTGLFRYR